MNGPILTPTNHFEHRIVLEPNTPLCVSVLDFQRDIVILIKNLKQEASTKSSNT